MNSAGANRQKSDCAGRGGSTKIRPTDGGAPLPAKPNLEGMPRFLYVVVGLALMGWGLFGAQTGWMRIAFPWLGAFVLVEGLVGYCVLRGALGIGGRKD